MVTLIGDFYETAARHFGFCPEVPEVRFDLRGRTAGQWRVQRGVERLRFNELLFAATPEAHIPDTVAHEVAHSAVYRCYGPKKVRPHGREWQRVMALFGVEPRVTHRTCPETLARVLDQHLYRCACRSHALGPRQHRHVRKGQRHYLCRACGERLVWVPES
ncbi:SprT-like domain-containing protein [Thioalkalivibrio denitrificans]|uniref:SprT family zinc-dependent metalloprotease n=1 Tax=Thioalkalivibrio denitrificans TaxID=108003 RepID=UPI001FEBA4EB|nr:SprT-like domain-containing protein [Thioalkalivibrio denitrificans]